MSATAPAGSGPPGLQIDLGHGDTWYGPTIRAYISRGNTSTPNSGLALGSHEDGTLESLSLDTRVVSDTTVTDPVTATTTRYVNLLRPTGRIVTFSFPSGNAEGKPGGVDTGNEYTMRDMGSYLDTFFYESSSDPDDIVIHRYPETGTKTVAGVAYGPAFDEGDAQSGTYGAWAGLTWNSNLTTAQTTKWDIDCAWGDNRITAIHLTPRGGTSALIRFTLAYGDDWKFAVKKEICLAGT